MDINEKVGSVEDQINKYVTAVRTIPKEKITAVIYIISTLVFVGFFQFLTAHFKPSIFFTASFWLSEVTTLIIIFTSYQGGINIVWNEQLKNKDLLQCIEEYKKLNVRDLDFELFLAEYNKKLKKDAFTRKTERILRGYERIIGIMIVPKWREKLYKKVKSMTEKVQPEYLREHIDEIQVKHYKVYCSDFFAASTKGTTGKFRSRGNAEFGKLKSSIKGFPMTIAIASLLSSTAYEIVESAFTTDVIVKLILNAVIFGWRLANGILKAGRVIYAEIQIPIEFKNQVLREYHEWQKKEEYNNGLQCKG